MPRRLGNYKAQEVAALLNEQRKAGNRQVLDAMAYHHVPEYRVPFGLISYDPEAPEEPGYNDVQIIAPTCDVTIQLSPPLVTFTVYAYSSAGTTSVTLSLNGGPEIEMPHIGGNMYQTEFLLEYGSYTQTITVTTSDGQTAVAECSFDLTEPANVSPCDWWVEL